MRYSKKHFGNETGTLPLAVWERDIISMQTMSAGDKQLMKVMLQLLLVAIVLLHPGDVGGQFTTAPPTCPSDTITFRCTVAGDSTGRTIWRVGGSSECLLSHSTPGASSNCGPGGVFTARFDTASATSFSSTLSGTATTALEGTLFECFGPEFSVLAGNRVGNSTLHIVGPPSVPSLSCIVLSEGISGAVNVTVSWILNGGGSADFYLINITTNDPQPPYGGLLNISNASVIQRELTGFQAGYVYTITVRGVNCGSQEGNQSEPLTITPQVPTTPMPNVRAEYSGTIGPLQTIESTWDEVDPVSVGCANGRDIRASYELSYTSSSGTSITTCVVNGTECSNGVCRHELQNNITDSRCQPPVPQFNNESVTVTVTAVNIVGRSNSSILMTPVPNVCAEYDRTTGTLQIIESTWNEVDIRASYELSYTSSSGTSITTCVVDGTDCSNGVCRHELQNNITDSRCQLPVPQFNNESVTVTVTAGNTAENSSVSRNINSMNALTVDVDSTDIENAFVQCTFVRGHTCTIEYSTDPSYTNLNSWDTSSTQDAVTTITLSQELHRDTTYYFIVSAESNSQCARVRGTFQTECTESDLSSTTAQDGMVDPRCTDRQFMSSLPISNGVVCYSGTTAMSEAIYICDDDFRLLGEAIRVCQIDGNWNGSIPQCILQGGVGSLTTGAAVGIAVATTAVLIMAGVLTGILLYHCISKQRSQNSRSKTESSSHQQQQTGPEYEEVSTTNTGEKIELRRNVAYEPVQTIEMKENEAYGQVQH